MAFLAELSHLKCRVEKYNTVDELWKRIHSLFFIAKKLLCLLVIVSLPNRFSGASERAQKHPGDAPYHVTSLPKDTKKTAGEINSLLNCHDTWPYTNLLNLFSVYYYFTFLYAHLFILSAYEREKTEIVLISE